jgi:hypothetical protein
MVSNLFFGQAYGSIYHYTDPPWWGLILIVMLWLAVASPLMQVKFRHARRPTRQFRILEVFLHRHILKFAILVALLIGLFYSSSSAGFRYVAGGLSSGGSLLIIVVILKAIANMLLMWLLVIFMLQNQKISRSDRATIWILTGVLFYTVSGTADVLKVMFFLIFAVAPKVFANLVFIKRQTTFSLKTLIWRLSSPPLLLALFFVALAGGDSIKATGKFGLDTQNIWFSASWLVARFVEGISSHYYALVQFFTQGVYYSLEQFNYPLSYPLSSIEYRVRELFGFDAIRPEIQSLSRLNFEVKSFKISSNEGTSPGILASFVYVVPLPLGLFCALFYLRWIISLIDRFFHIPGFRLSLFGALFVLMQFLFAYESPIDFLILLDGRGCKIAALIRKQLYTRICPQLGALLSQNQRRGHCRYVAKISILDFHLCPYIGRWGATVNFIPLHCFAKSRIGFTIWYCDFRCCLQLFGAVQSELSQNL